MQRLEHDIRAGHAGGGPPDRPAADRRDRQGAGAGRADPDHGRADLGAVARRRSRSCSRSSPTSRRAASAIVYISHRLEELIRIGDHITVLRDGHITGQPRRWRTSTCRGSCEQMIGADVEGLRQGRRPRLGRRSLPRREDLPAARRRRLAVDHVSLSLRAGEILGIYGLMGAGRTEFFECIMAQHPGMPPARSSSTASRSTAENVAGRIAARASPWSRRTASATGWSRSCRSRENMSLASAAATSRGGSISTPAPKRRGGQSSCASSADQGRRAPRIRSVVAVGRQPAEGGDRQGADDRAQGAADGRAEPRHRRRRQGRGLPDDAQAGGGGLGILFVTSDLEEVMALSDRILVMANGRLTGEFDRAERDRGGDRRRVGHRAMDQYSREQRRMTDMPARRRARPAARGRNSALLLLLKARTFIALIAGASSFFSLAAPNFLSAANADPDVQACRPQRLPRHRHDLRHHHRRHRPVGRLDRRAVRHGRGLSGPQRHRPRPGLGTRSSSTPSRSC